MYSDILQIRIVYHHNGGYVFYTLVMEHDCGEILPSHKFITKKECLSWCDREHPGVPVYG